MNVIFTCGGTGGHINPAIAVANIWKERHPDSKILYTDFREAGRTANNYSASCAPLAQLEELTEEEKAAGTWTRKIPEEGVHFKVYFENKYGIWTHTMIKF